MFSAYLVILFKTILYTGVLVWVVWLALSKKTRVLPRSDKFLIAILSVIYGLFVAWALTQDHINKTLAAKCDSLGGVYVSNSCYDSRYNEAVKEFNLKTAGFKINLED